MPWLLRQGLALALLVGAGAAQARSDVNWAVGISAPGVAVGVGNGYPAVVAPAPVYYAPPPPVYYAPPPPACVLRATAAGALRAACLRGTASWLLLP